MLLPERVEKSPFERRLAAAVSATIVTVCDTNVQGLRLFLDTTSSERGF